MKNRDKSIWLLLFTNIVFIVAAIKGQYSFPQILMTYWVQSVIIGLFNFFKILSLKNFSTKDFSMNGKSVKNTTRTKINVAFFFLFHYGTFHLVYLIFILVEHGRRSVDLSLLGWAALGFFLNHLFSAVYNYRTTSQKENIGQVMFFPYLRIIPMHLVIIFGSAMGQGAFVFFMLLKTAVDSIMHWLEHKQPVGGNV